MKTLTLAIATASIGLVGLSAPATAQESVKKSTSVSYAGLNLNTLEGQELLAQRLEIAARRVCDYNGPSTTTRIRKDARKCLAKARTNARRQMASIIADQRRGG